MSIDYRLQASVQIQVMEQHYEIKKKPRFCPPNEKPKLQQVFFKKKLEQVSSCRKQKLQGMHALDELFLLARAHSDIRIQFSDSYKQILIRPTQVQ